MNHINEALQKYSIEHPGDSGPEHPCVTCGAEVEPVTYGTGPMAVTEHPAQCRNCHAQWLYRVALRECGIPPRIQGDAEQYKRTPIKPLRPLINRVAKGDSVLIYGPTGPGKSVLAAQVTMACLAKQLRGYWLHESQLPEVMWEDREKYRLKRLAKAQFVVVDDLGIKASIAQATNTFVDWAYSEQVPLIVTANHDLDHLYADEVYRRAASRLSSMCSGGVVAMMTADRRRGNP